MEEQLEQRFTEMEEKLDCVDRKVTQVVDAIVGNPLTKEGGLLKKVGEVDDKLLKLEDKVLKLEDFKKRVYWTLALIVGLTIFLTYITTIYFNVKSNDKNSKNVENHVLLG